MRDKLIEILTESKLKELGFVNKVDETDRARKWWEFENDDYSLIINCSFKVKLYRLEPATDGLKLKIKSLLDLEKVIDWID